METERHRHQMNLLIDSLAEAWNDRDDFYVGGNMFVYYSELQAKRNDFRAVSNVARVFRASFALLISALLLAGALRLGFWDRLALVACFPWPAVATGDFDGAGDLFPDRAFGSKLFGSKRPGLSS